MRAYVAVAPDQIAQFLREESFFFGQAFALTPLFSQAHPGEDEEEMEFELSLLAAQSSRAELRRVDDHGFVLAVDVLESQKGLEGPQSVELVSPLTWSQVDSLLVLQSSEEELTWFAAQEIAGELPSWLVTDPMGSPS